MAATLNWVAANSFLVRQENALHKASSIDKGLAIFSFIVICFLSLNGIFVFIILMF